MMSTRERQELIALALKHFWGKAKLPNGKYVEPASEQERKTVPVSNAIAQRAIDAGEISGLGEWCGLDWKPHYLALTRAARTRGLGDKQVAFVSFVHGAAQGRVVRALSTGRACNEAERSKFQRYLNESAQQGLDG